MAEAAAPARWEAALCDLDAAIAAAPAAIEPRFERARLLTLLGRDDAAKAAYLDLLAQAPGHAGALNNLGSLLHAGGYRSAARIAYGEAVHRHPEQPMGRVNLGNILGEEGAWAAARAQYEAALRSDPGHLEAHRGLAHALDELGEAAAAEHHRRRGFAGAPLTTLPYRGTGRPVTVLLLVAAGGGNVPLRHLLDDRVFQVHVAFAEFCAPQMVLPRHDLVVNAIADADRCGTALDAGAMLLEGRIAPVINPPAAVRDTGRAAIARRLAGLPGLIVPRVAALRRETLAASDAVAALEAQGFAFPLLLRVPGFQTGRHFVRVDGADALPAALAQLPGDRLLAIECLDARGADGRFRKYRVMFVEGRLYPLHLATSAAWKVHFFTAAMAGQPDARAADAAFLADMAGTLGRRSLAVLERVRDRLGLDYAGIDFAVAGDGRILLFEANAAMVVNPPDPDPLWSYRQTAVARIHDAVRTMLRRRAAGAVNEILAS
jgi:hypothetical protein